MAGPDRAFLQRAPVVARLVLGRLAPVDEERGGRERLGIELCHLRRPPADCVDVRALFQPAKLEDGRRRVRGGHDDVRVLHGLLRRAGRLHAELLRQRLSMPGRRAVEDGLAEVVDRAHRVEVRTRLHARAEDRELAGVLPGEETCRDR